MRWFQGTIPEAVSACKLRQAIFVVFVEGTDDASKNALSTLEDSTITSQLETDDFIVIKLDSGSESYRQFAQIYQLVPVPSIFFISPNGTPLEVVAGEIAVADLSGRIKLVLSKSGKSASSEAVLPPKQEKATTSPVEAIPSTSTAPKQEQVAASPAEAVPSTSSAPTETEMVAPSEPEETVETKEPAASTSATNTLSIEEKVERAKELIEKKRQLKQQEELKMERERELERRRVSQELQKMQQLQQERELKEIREQKRKEKLEEQAARQRVLEQIKQDRADRAARMAVNTQREETETREETGNREESRVTPPPSNIARIQFRLPDGSSHANSFPADTTLAEVRTYAAANLNLPFREFVMSTTFPRREFTATDNPLSVRDLGLVPTAVILILPASGAVVRSHGYFELLASMVWPLLAPLAAMLTYFRDFIFRRGNNSDNSTPRPVNSPSNPTPESNKSQTTRRRAGHLESTSTIKRVGNIHRLTARRDSSDDENNTWNGNSTQQM